MNGLSVVKLQEMLKKYEILAATYKGVRDKDSPPAMVAKIQQELEQRQASLPKTEQGIVRQETRKPNSGKFDSYLERYKLIDYDPENKDDKDDWS
jgi:predicted translin family RNA/ssDNA-binding protein